MSVASFPARTHGSPHAQARAGARARSPTNQPRAALAALTQSCHDRPPPPLPGLRRSRSPTKGCDAPVNETNRPQKRHSPNRQCPQAVISSPCSRDDIAQFGRVVCECCDEGPLNFPAQFSWPSDALKWSRHRGGFDVIWCVYVTFVLSPHCHVDTACQTCGRWFAESVAILLTLPRSDGVSNVVAGGSRSDSEWRTSNGSRRKKSLLVFFNKQSPRAESIQRV